MTRRQRARKPPPALLQQRVLAYAVLPRSVPFLGDNSIFVGSPGGELLPIGRVPRLAICEAEQGGVSLHFCDGTWGNVASTECETIEKAKARAERSYPGSSRHWIAARVSKARVTRYLEH